jgi:excisionase family DNA binding protein
MTNNDEDLLTLKQAATFMKIKPRTLYDWVSRRSVPFLRAGRSLRFSKPVLINWMKERAES